MDTNIKFIKINTTERNLDLKPSNFSRIFLMDTTITILNNCVLFGDIKINLEVKHASKFNNFLVFNSTESLYLLDFKNKILYKFEGDEQDFVKSEFNGENLEILYSNGIYKSYKLGEILEEKEIGEILEDKEIKIRKEEDVNCFYRGGIINKEVDDVLSTPFGDIFIKNEKMKFNEKEFENELYYGDNNDKTYYYFTTFKDFILLGSSNNSNLYLYDFNLKLMDNEGKDGIFIQTDKDFNQLYIRGMDYNKGKLMLIDLKGNVIEYFVKINKEINNEINNEISDFNEKDNKLCFKSKILKVQGDKLKIEDCEIKEFKEITENKNETKIEKPSIKLSENPEGLSFIQFNKDLLSSDELREDQTFTDEEISILSKNEEGEDDTDKDLKLEGSEDTEGKDGSDIDNNLNEVTEDGHDSDQNNNVNDCSEIFKTSILDDKNNLSDLKTSMNDIKNNLSDLKSNLNDKQSVFGDIKSNLTDKKNVFTDLKINLSEVKSNPFSSSFNKENSKSVVTESNNSTVTGNNKNIFGKATVSDQSTVIKSDQSAFTEDNKNIVTEGNQSIFTEGNKSVFEKAKESTFEKPESVKNVFNKDEITKSPFSKGSTFQTTSFQFTKSPSQSFQSQPTKSIPISSLDSVDDIISSILSIKTNFVSINNYKINNTTDRLESQIYSSMSKLKRINDLKREIESNLLIMINNLDTFKKIDSKSIEDSMRYFDEVIERKTRHKTPLIYNSPIIEPDLREINQISTTLEEDLSKLNLNVLTKIKIEPVYLIDKIKIRYNEDKDVKDKKEEGRDKDEGKEGGPQTNTSFFIKNNPEKETNLKESNLNTNVNPSIPSNIQSNNIPSNAPSTLPSNAPSTLPSNMPHNPIQPPTTPNPFQSNPPHQPNSSDIFSRVLGSSIPVIQKEENKETNNKPPSAFSKFASSHNLFK